MRLSTSLAVLLLAAAVPTVATAQTEVDPDRLAQHIQVLSDDSFLGRGIATEGETRTIDYLSQQFAAAGFEPGGVDGGWTQPVTLRRFAVEHPEGSLTVGGWTQPLVQGEQAVFSTRLPGDHVHIDDAPLVFVGYGVTAPERNWDDFKDVDVRGKIIVVLVNDPDFEQPELNTFGGRAMTYYGRWTYKYEEAARRGAAGVLVVHEDAPASYGWATVRNSWSGPQFDIVRENAEDERAPLEGWIQRDLAVELFDQAGLDFEALKVAARSPDFRPVELAGASMDAMFHVQTETIETNNIIARLPGAERPDETILYGAHWDHIGVGEPDESGDGIFNGAVDNASGTGALVEVARAFSAGPRPERSIVLIAFTAEESGLLGSEYYAANPLYPLETTVAGFNMDAMNVYGRTTDISVTGHGQSELDDLLEAAARTQDRAIAPDRRPEAGGFFRSDHFPLVKRGVPMMYAGGGSTFRDEPVAPREAARAEYGRSRYHQAADEWSDDFDLRGMAQDIELFVAIGRDLANSTDWPGWQEGSEFGPARAASADARD